MRRAESFCSSGVSVSHAGHTRKRGRIRVDQPHLLHTLDTLGANDVIALVIPPLVAVQPIVRQRERTVNGLVGEVSKERLAIGLVLINTVHDEVTERLRGEVIVREFLHQLAIA
jgi:hypothetical protein